MSFEKYQPSPEEIKKAEEMMTDEQKKLSEAREEGYNIAKSEQGAEKLRERNPAEPTIEKYGGGSYKILAPEKPYREETTVNGVEISIHWDNGYGDYVIYFPQIELGDTAYEKGVSDQVLRISQKPEVAKQVFDYASKLAQTEKDVYEIYKKVDEFSRDLPHDLEEE